MAAFVAFASDLNDATTRQQLQRGARLMETSKTTAVNSVFSSGSKLFQFGQVLRLIWMKLI